MSRCGRYEDLLIRFVHGELLRSEKEEIELHLDECESCCALYRDVAEADRLLRGEPEKLVEPAPYLRQRILARLEETSAAPSGFRWVRWAAAFGGIAAAGVALLLAVREPARQPQVAMSTPPAPPPAQESIRSAPVAQPRKAPEPGERPGARRVPNGVQIVREVKIYFYYPPAQKVAVTGDFNGWAHDGVPLEPAGKPGLWATKLHLKPGAYSYNFIVDGETLVPDPSAPTQAPDGYGGTNSILLVKGENPA